MVEAREQPRLVDERAQADRVGLGEGARAHGDLRPLAARRERRRHVLLERDLALERVVLRQVDDAEAADAEHAHDLEFAEAGAWRKRVVVGARRRGDGLGGEHGGRVLIERHRPSRTTGDARAYRRAAQPAIRPPVGVAPLDSHE